MRTLLLSSLLTMVLLSSCKDDDVELAQEPILKLDETITLDGLTRTYHIQHPEDHNNKPMVVVLHGHGGSSDQSIGEGLGKNPQKIWLDVALEHDFIVVVPNGELGSEDTRGWNDCRTDAPANPTTDDVDFIKQLLEELEQQYNYDVSRVYVSGVSNGALMAHRLVQEIPEKITAFASIVNTIPENSICTNSDDAISALFMNGTADPLAPYEGGQISSTRGLVKSTNESVRYWVERNQTETAPLIEILEDVNTNDNSTVEKLTYDSGTNNSQVVLYRIIGGGHTEPSLLEKYSQLYKNIVGEQNEDIEMAEEVWKFFKDKRK